LKGEEQRFVVLLICRFPHLRSRAERATISQTLPTHHEEVCHAGVVRCRRLCGGLFSVFAGSILTSIKLLYEYERGVVFTWGKYASTRGHGLTIILPVAQWTREMDTRIKTAEIPHQEAITKDNI
jgi:hypothetical protein